MESLKSRKIPVQKNRKDPAFAIFVQKPPKRKEILPEWRRAHRGLGRKWKAMNCACKAKYVSASKHMKDSYEKHMNAYRPEKGTDKIGKREPLEDQNGKTE